MGKILAVKRRNMTIASTLARKNYITVPRAKEKEKRVVVGDKIMPSITPWATLQVGAKSSVAYTETVINSHKKVELGLFTTNKKLFKNSQMKFIFMLYCKTSKGLDFIFCSWIVSSKLCSMFWPREWLYKTNFTEYSRNLARFIESSAGKSQWLFYALLNLK